MPKNKVMTPGGHRMRRVGGLSILFATLALGCSSLKDGTDTAGLGYDPWLCVRDNLDAQELPKRLPTVIHYIVPIVDFAQAPSDVDQTSASTAAEIKNLNIALCKVSDNCSTPLPITVTKLDPPYLYAIDIPNPNVAMFLRMTEPLPKTLTGPPTPADLAPLHIPTSYYFGGELGFPVASNQDGGITVQGQPIAIPTYGETAAIAMGLNQALTANTGFLVVRTIDCHGLRAGGVTLSVYPSSRVATAVSFNLTSGGEAIVNDPGVPATPTDGRAAAGFANVPSGAIVVSGVIAKKSTQFPLGLNAEAPFGSSGVSISANELTITEVRPKFAWPQ